MTNLRRTALSWLPAIAVCLGAGGCNDSSHPSSLPPPPGNGVVARQVSGVLVDASTGQLVAKPATLVIRDASGNLSTVARGAGGLAITQVTTQSGIVTFAIDPAAPLPVKLTLVADAEGYFGGSAKVEVASAGAQSFQIALASATSAPAGAAAVQQVAGSATSTGVTAAPVSIATPAETQTGGTASLAVPAATTVTTVDGRPLTGALTASVAYFNNAEPGALSAFPGGFTVTAPPAQGAPAETKAFIAGGFTAIELKDAAGNVAASFDHPIDVQISVPATTVNPQTNGLVQPGDQIGVYSYSESTGLWRNEGSYPIQGTGSAMFVKAAVNHLSYFASGWMKDTCNAKVVPSDPSLATLPLFLMATRRGGGYLASQGILGGEFPLVNAPRATTLDLVVTYLGQVLGTAAVADICAGNVTINLSPPAKPSGTIVVHVDKVCVEDRSQRTAQASATVSLQPAGGTWRDVVQKLTNASGDTAQTTLTEGDYSVYAQPYGDTKPKVITANVKGSSRITVEIDVTCSTTGASGGAR